MMSIHDLIERHAKQTCVYWEKLVEDGYGNMTFSSPMELMCRWQDMTQVLGTITGNQILGFNETSRAVLWLTRSVEDDSMVFLGSFEDIIDISSSDSADSSGTVDLLDPRAIEGAYIIKRVEKIPSLGSTTDFLYKAHLSPWLT